MKYPRSPYDREGGMVYFPRMLDKIRLNLRGDLPEDYAARLGRGMDGRCCRFLRVAYRDVVEQVKSGSADGEILEWCSAHGRRPDEDEIVLWNGFMTKRGWRDEAATEALQEFKAAGNLADRDDIQTFFDFFEVDEGRKP